MLFVNYLQVITSYGDLAKDIQLSRLVREAAIPFTISESRAYRIINSMLKEYGKNCYLLPDECTEILKGLQTFSRPGIESTVFSLDKLLISVGVKRTHEEVKQLVQEYLITSV